MRRRNRELSISLTLKLLPRLALVIVQRHHNVASPEEPTYRRCHHAPVGSHHGGANHPKKLRLLAESFVDHPDLDFVLHLMMRHPPA